MPTDVNLIRVIKNYKDSGEEIKSKTFSIRKNKVIRALKWLTQYNYEYKRKVTICELNLNWIVNDESELPASTTQRDTDETENDLGPAPLQTMVTHTDTDGEDNVLGTTLENNVNIPDSTDTEVIHAINNSLKSSRANNAINFPYVSTTPVSEYDTNSFLFEHDNTLGPAELASKVSELVNN